MKERLARLLNRLRSPQSMNRTDRLLLRWAGLSFAVLVLIVILTAAGTMEYLEWEQIRLLCADVEGAATQEANLLPLQLLHGAQQGKHDDEHQHRKAEQRPAEQEVVGAGHLLRAAQALQAVPESGKVVFHSAG